MFFMIFQHCNWPVVLLLPLLLSRFVKSPHPCIQTCLNTIRCQEFKLICLLSCFEKLPVNWTGHLPKTASDLHTVGTIYVQLTCGILHFIFLISGGEENANAYRDCSSIHHSRVWSLLVVQDTGMMTLLDLWWCFLQKKYHHSGMLYFSLRWMVFSFPTYHDFLQKKITCLEVHFLPLALFYVEYLKRQNLLLMYCCRIWISLKI